MALLPGVRGAVGARAAGSVRGGLNLGPRVFEAWGVSHLVLQVRAPPISGLPALPPRERQEITAAKPTMVDAGIPRTFLVDALS